MSDLKSNFTEEQIKNLEMARLTYQGRLRDFINRRAAELLKFGKMQASLIMKPNQNDVQAQVQILQKLDFEIKRLGDCVMACTVLLSYHTIPAIMENLKHIRDVIPTAYEALVATNADLEKTPVESVICVTIVRDFAQFAGALYPQTNIFEQADFVRHQNLQDAVNGKSDDERVQEANTRGVDGLSGSLLVSV